MKGWGSYRPDAFVSLRVSQLRGVVLEWAVAAHEEYTTVFDYTSWQPKVRVNEVNEPGNRIWWLTIWGNGVIDFTPLSNWMALGELIEKYDITFSKFEIGDVTAYSADAGSGVVIGDTRNEAICRAVLGNGIVDVPWDLAVFSGCDVDADQQATAFTSDGTPISVVAEFATSSQMR